MKHEIKWPLQTTYYIVLGDQNQVRDYGELATNQVLTTGQPNIETYLIRNLWKTRLKLAYGIEIE